MRSFLFLTALLGLSPLVHAGAEADLLVAYDNSYSDSVGGNANAEVLALNAVAASNLINERSGTGARMRICGYHKTWWQGNRSTVGGYVGWLANYGDNNLNDVTAAADARGADLVAYICQATDSGIAAVAQQPGRYAAYNPGNFWANVVAHESGGHNYGIDHRTGRQNPKTIMMHNYCGGGSNGYYSNPNLRLNGVQLTGDGGCLGSALQGGDAAYYIGAAAQGVADRNARVTVNPNLGNVVRRWRFDQGTGSAPNGMSIPDEVGGSAQVTVSGNGASYSGNGLTIPGGTGSSGAAYLRLPSNLTDGYTNITLEVWATPLSARNWGRVLELTDGTTNNYLMLASSRGTNLDDQRFESKVGGSTRTIDNDLPTVAGMPHHYVITFRDNGSGGGTWFHYRDGELLAWFDVDYNLATFPDTSNWLGRSVYSADDLAHCEYAEVRLSNVAMSLDEIFANYQLGPNHDAATIRLTAGDALGQTSFNAGTNWSDGLAPSAGKSYETYNFRLRTPADGTSRTFAGSSLTVSGGSITYKGNNSTTTFGDLTLKGGAEFIQAGSGTWTVAGNMNVMGDLSTIRAANAPITLAANLTGSGGLLCLDNTVTLTGNNASFDGRITVGDGRFSRLAIDSESRLGANPAIFIADQLAFNRGILYTTGNVTIDDANRGLRIGESAAMFNVAPGSTLTLATPLSSPSSGSTLQTAPLYPNPVSGLFIKQNTGTLVLTHPNNSATNEIVIEGGTLALEGGGRINNGDHFLPITNNGTLKIATSADQTIGGVISGNGPLLKDGTGTLSLTANNTFTGQTTVNEGTLRLTKGGATGTIQGSLTVNSGATVQLNAVDAIGYSGGNPVPLLQINGGMLNNNVAGNNSASTNWELTGGTMTSTGGGSFHLGYLTANTITTNASATPSTISGNIVLRSGNTPTITVADGSADADLLISGDISEGDGPSGITKSGTGTLALSGENSYTGPTSLGGGTTLVNGSLGTTTVSVANVATLGGTGSLAGPTTINGTHAPGASAGTQTFGSTLAYGSTSRLKWELDSNSTSAGSFDKVTAFGAVAISSGAKLDVVLNAAGSTVALDSAFWTQPRQWTFLNGASLSGSFALGTVSNDAGGRPVSDFGSFALQQNATSATLVFTPHTPGEVWRIAHFGFPENSGPAADSANPDGDLMDNLMERALGADPNVSDNEKLPAIDPAAPLLSLLYRKSSAAVDLTIEVQESTDLLAPWVPATGEASIVSDSGGIQLLRFTRLAGTDARLFLRVKVTYQ